MADRSLLITYAPDHGQYAPPVQYFDGAIERYPEQPARAERLLEALRAAPFTVATQVVTRTPSQDRLVAVHAPEYLDFLHRVGGQADLHRRPYFGPSVFP